MMHRKSTIYRQAFKRVAVLGTGTMGSQVAAHLANCGCECLLFGVTAEQDPRYTAAAALKGLAKLKPPALVGKQVINSIKPCDYDNDLELLTGCSLIIEAVSENLDIKHELYGKVVPHLAPEAFFATNTSGIPIAKLGEILPAALRERFCGVHFFNPPRYMPLVELIPHAATKPAWLDSLEGFLTTVLGKQVVYSKDSPGFIANRLGIFSMAAVFHWMQEYDLAPDTVDELCGGLIGRAKSACFRTADVVGLDIVQGVMENLQQNLPDDPWHDYLVLPAWLQGLIKEGSLGQKTRKGVYEKTKEGIKVFDPALGKYRLQEKRKSKEIKEIFAETKSLAEALPRLRDSADPQAKFLWAIQREVFQYAAVHLPAIAANVRDLDQAMIGGFGWEHGIFRLWQAAGAEQLSQLITADNAAAGAAAKPALPEWTKRDTYTAGGAYAPESDAYQPVSANPVYERQLISMESDKWRSNIKTLPEVVIDNPSLRMIDLQDGVAAVNFKTKMNTLDYDLIKSLGAALAHVESDYESLIIWQPSGPFCAGANLYQILAGAKLGKLEKGSMISSVKQKAFEALNPKLPKLGDLPAVRDVIMELQNLFMQLKHSPFPVVAAVQGLTLGGGCELVMHTDRVVAANDSFIGLVELGVGVLPAGAGSKEIARRSDELTAGLDNWGMFMRLQHFYASVAMAKVSGSATEAREMGFLRPADKIIANPRELLYVAKKECLAMMDESYVPPPRRHDIRVGGRPAIANFLAYLANLREGDFISEHDYLCAGELARVICGGDLDAGATVSDEWLLALEREGFLTLLKTKLTQERIQHTLKTGKPLRN